MNKKKFFALLGLGLFASVATVVYISQDDKEKSAIAVNYGSMYEMAKNNQILEADIDPNKGIAVAKINVDGVKFNQDVIEKMNEKDAYKAIEAALVSENSSAPVVPTTVSVSTTIPRGDERLISVLLDNNVAVDIPKIESPSFLGNLFWMLLPIFVMVGLFAALYIWMAKKAGGGMSSVLGYGKHKGKRIAPNENTTRFKDVAGCDEVKQEVLEVVDFLHNPQKYQKLGAKVPRGVLMEGPAGTGKTLLAKAIAGEAGVPFFSVAGSDFLEMFVGVGASRVRDLFEEARKEGRAVIFIDEIDAVGRARSGVKTGGGGNDEREQTINAMLAEMDGFSTTEGVIVIAATNRADILDPALTRPGRFDRKVTVGLPDLEGRTAILKVHAQKVPVADDVDWVNVARGTPGFSGAQLANLINEAAIFAARKDAKLVGVEHLEEARDKVILGPEKKGAMKNTETLKVTAIHEAGHAIVAHFSELADPVHKITIVPRGGALGLTWQLPSDEGHNYNLKRILTEVDVLMGGRAAEEVVLNDKTVGASNDFQRAERMIRRAVTVWGMGKMGPVSINDEQADFMNPSPWSEKTREAIDEEVKGLLNERYQAACALLRKYRSELDKVSEALLEKETLTAEDFVELVGPGVGESKNRSGGFGKSKSKDKKSLDSNEPKVDEVKTDEKSNIPVLNPSVAFQENITGTN